MMRICICASTLIFHREALLFIWHEKLNVWMYPGGHVEKNESPDVAARRETLEETGIRVELYEPGFKAREAIKGKGAAELLRPFKIIYEKVHYPKEDHEHFDMVYIAFPNKGDISGLGSGESKRFMWVGREGIPELDTYDNVKEVALDALTALASGD